MPRHGRINIAGQLSHVIARGNERHGILFENEYDAAGNLTRLTQPANNTHKALIMLMAASFLAIMGCGSARRDEKVAIAPSRPDFQNISRLAVTGGLCEYIDILVPTVELTTQLLARNDRRQVINSTSLIPRWGVGLLSFSLPAEFRRASQGGAGGVLAATSASSGIKVPEHVAADFRKIQEADAFLVIWLDDYSVTRNFFHVVSKSITVHAGIFEAVTGKLAWHMNSVVSVPVSPVPSWPDSIVAYSKPDIIFEHDPLAQKAAEAVAKRVLQ